MRRILPATALLILLASCVGAPKPAPVRPLPAPAYVPPPPPAPAPLASDWRDWPLTPGDWQYVRYNGRPSATFGRPDSGALTLSCTAERTIRITKPGSFTGPMTIRTTSMSRALTTMPLGSPATGSVATLVAADPLLDAMGFSRGRFIVEQAGQAPLVVPAWAEIDRVVEDCRG